MSLSRLRLIPSALALAAVAVLAVGCSSTPGASAPTSTSGAGSAPGTPTERGADDVAAAWLDDGRMIAIVTWGSSTPDCQPQQAEATADGQTIEVTLDNPTDTVKECNADLGPRAVLAAVPAGVDVTKDVTAKVTWGDVARDVPLSPLKAAPRGQGEQQPSAGWFDDTGIVLLTYGSSTCPPLPETVLESNDEISVGFATIDRICTMDFAPRTTAITLSSARTGDGPYTLRLQGDDLDGEVAVIG